ncbi:MAG: hypothetical protein FJX23_04220 [Alphaproteobacteria bacterium]|nr:hypothetical protein [Alphaproteobacteria bacterium]
MGNKREYLIRIPICLLATLGVTACSGSSTYFISAKNQQRYNASDIAPNIFDDEEEDNYQVWRNSGSRSGLDVPGRTNSHSTYRDSSVIGKLYFDADGEGRGEKPYALTIRKSYRSYDAEAPLSEPIKIGKHELTPHLSFGRHKDHDYMTGIRFRMPF